MLLLLDNYDSFTYNLSQYLEELLDEEVAVIRNDQLSVGDVEKYDRIVLSPGPGLPNEAGILMPILQKYMREKPILGVCLGHQAITLAFGGQLRQLDEVLHGVSRKVFIQQPGHPLFKGIVNPFEAGRYHSWVPDEAHFPKELAVLACGEDGSIMVLQHQTLPVTGVQFHPESIMTPSGKLLLKNWLQLTEQKKLSLQ